MKYKREDDGVEGSMCHRDVVLQKQCECSGRSKVRVKSRKKVLGICGWWIFLDQAFVCCHNCQA